MRHSRSALLCSSTSFTPTFSAVTLGIVLLCTVLVSGRGFAAAPDRITGPIDSQQLVRLSAGVPLKAKPKFDRGPVDPSFGLNYMTLLIVPSASQQKAVDKLLAQQQDPHSPLYHQWLTPEDYADQFGLSPNDIQKLTIWLQSYGFAVLKVARSRNMIAFSGTAAQVEIAFQTPIHNFNVDGEKHFSNTTPPSIPFALSGIVSGFGGLNDFRPHPMIARPTSAKSGTRPFYYSSSLGEQFLAPADIATIYNIGAGLNGSGQTIAVIGQTDVYLADLVDFRSGFSLPAITDCTTDGNLLLASCGATSAYLQYVLVGSDAAPSLGDLPEADLDLEWSGATASQAQIIYVNSPSGNGVWDAWHDAVTANIAPIITMSYGLCELGEAENGAFSFDENLLKQANSQGITFMNASGDSGAAECDPPQNNPNEPYATLGLAVSYPASSPEVTGVGGTMIPLGEYGSQYWNITGTVGGSALSYIPENGWNDDAEFGAFCAANPTNTFCTGNGITNQQTAQAAIGMVATGGGPSGCFTIDANSYCTGGFPQPTWQAKLSIPGQTTPVRFTPDVSLLASPDFPGYIWCTPVEELSSTSPYSAETTSSCANGIAAAVDGMPASNPNLPFIVDPSIIGGTSASTPIFAGMVALLNQYAITNHLQTKPGLGNINSNLYQIATNYDSTVGASLQAFNPVTAGLNEPGSNTIYCVTGTPGYGAPATALNCPAVVAPATEGIFGYFSANDDTATPSTHYNLVTGLGSVNVNNLFRAWSATEGAAATATTVASSQDPAILGVSVTFTATVTTTGTDQPTGTITFNDGTTLLGTGTLSTVNGSQVATFATSTLALGAHSITAVYGGDPNNTGGTSAVLTQYITGSTTTHTTVISSQNPAPLLGPVTFTATVTSTGSHVPTGIVTFNDGATAIGTGTISTVSGSQVATFSTSSLAAGANSITAVYDGDANNASSTSALTETITNFTLSTPTTPAPVLAGLAATSTFTVAPPSGATTFAASVVLTVSGLPANTTYSFSTNPIPAGSGATTETLTITTVGPNTTPGGQIRRRADKRSPGLPLALPLAGIVMVGFAGRRMSRHSAAAGLCVSLVLLALLIACGGGSSSSPPPPPGVTVTPSSASVPLGGTQQFTASTTVTWSIPSGAPGTISVSGLYTAPTTGTTPVASFNVTATPATGTAGTASITIPAVGVSVSGSGGIYANDAADNWPPQTAQLMATVTNASNGGVNWAFSNTTLCTGSPNPCGSLSSTTSNPTTYTAPTVAANLPASVSIIATSAADPSKSGSAVETIMPATIPGTYPGITVSASEGGAANPPTATLTLTVN